MKLPVDIGEKPPPHLAEAEGDEWRAMEKMIKIRRHLQLNGRAVK
jgi:hypothetical protein